MLREGGGGVWCVVCGVWCVVCGMWCVVVRGGGGGGRVAHWCSWGAERALVKPAEQAGSD